MTLRAAPGNFIDISAGAFCGSFEARPGVTNAAAFIPLTPVHSVNTMRRARSLRSQQRDQISNARRRRRAFDSICIAFARPIDSILGHNAHLLRNARVLFDSFLPREFLPHPSSRIPTPNIIKRAYVKNFSMIRFFLPSQLIL
jgi:hypothetical protein